MIGAEVMLVEVTRAWIGKPYADYFGHIFKKQSCLAIGIVREARVGVKQAPGRRSSLIFQRNSSFGANGAENFGGSYRQFVYIFTAPPAFVTNMCQGDHVICFAASRV